MTSVEKLIATARGELGYLEKASNSQLDSKTANAGHANYTKYARDLDNWGVYHAKKNGYAWCDMYVDWCFIQTFGLETAMQMTFQPMGGYGAGCTASAQYYKEVRRFCENDPQPGDQIFFSKDGGKTMCHTGLVEKVANGRVYTIEGNTSSAPGVVENGGCVRNKSYSLDDPSIGGYGRPNFALVPATAPIAPGPSTFEQKWLNMRKKLQDNDCGSWSAEARDWAIKSGLIVGSGAGPDGQPNYMWADVLTREQAIVLLHRFAQLLGAAQ